MPAYWSSYGPANFLWLCDAANFIVAVGLLLESPLILASQAVSVLVVSLVWTADVVARLLFGVHPVGGTEYMFDPGRPLALRLLSLFHVVMPVLLLWLIARLGYDRRGWKLQTLIAWTILPLSYLFGTRETNLNWLWRVFGREQTWMDPRLWLLVAMALYPLVLYLPTHAVLSVWSRRREERRG